MSITKIQGIERIEQWPRKQTGLLFDAINKKNSKITGFVLDRLGSSNSFGRSTTLPEAFASRAMIDVLSSLAAPIRNRSGEESRDHLRKKRSKQADSLAPLGLRPCALCEWANAWILFLIHLPKFTELVSFCGKSFEPFRIFVDQYLIDQKEGRSVSLADSSSLIRCFSQNHPFFLSRFSKMVDLYEMLRSLLKSLFFPMTLDGYRNSLKNQNFEIKPTPEKPDSSSCFGMNTGFCDSIVFHPEWVMIWDGKSVASFNEQMQNILHSHPSEMMLAVKHCGHFDHSMIQRQIFLNRGRCFYDLDAFIECRPDAKGTHFVTYLRTCGVWYQCDDEKVRHISSRTLSVPLSRGVLFHYKRSGI